MLLRQRLEPEHPTDTFAEEEPVDLAAVRDDIKRIEAEKAAAIAKVEGMLSQLGL